MNQLHLLVLSSLFLVASNAFAQTTETAASSSHPTYRSLEKGTWTWGINASAGNSDKIVSGSLTPQIGYTLADRLVLGLQFSAAHRFSKQGSSWTNFKRGSIREYALTPEVYARYYILPYRITPFVQLSTGYNFGEVSIYAFNTNDYIEGTSTNNFVVSGAAGVSMRVGKKMGIQAQYKLPLVIDAKTNDLLRSNRFRLGLSLYLK